MHECAHLQLRGVRESERGEDSGRARDGDVAGGLDTDVSHLEVVEDDGVALRAGAEVARGEVLGEPEQGGPARLGVGEREDLCVRKV